MNESPERDCDVCRYYDGGCCKWAKAHKAPIWVPEAPLVFDHEQGRNCACWEEKDE